MFIKLQPCLNVYFVSTSSFLSLLQPHILFRNKYNLVTTRTLEQNGLDEGNPHISRTQPLSPSSQTLIMNKMKPHCRISVFKYKMAYAVMYSNFYPMLPIVLHQSLKINKEAIYNVTFSNSCQGISPVFLFCFLH